MIEELAIGPLFAPVVSAIVVIILYHYIGKDYLGADENALWNNFRVLLLSAGDSIVRQKTKFYLTNTIADDEFVGRVKMDSEKLAMTFESRGYTQNILSGLKYRPPNVDPNRSTQVEFESGSMALRESKSDLIPDALALRQVHVFWFDNGNGTLDVYAHEEYSSLNPLVAWQHYTGKTQDHELGVKIAKKDLKAEDVTLKE